MANSLNNTMTSQKSKLNESGDCEERKNEKDSTLPTINERLGHLRPSRQLLEYYRRKIAEYDDEHDAMMRKLDKYRMTYEEKHKIQWELRQREEEIAELQKALSDMQVYLFQEREHVLRLYAENDRLKIRELEDRKKIQTLLTLSGMTEREISYFMKEPPAKVVIPQKLPPKLQAELARDKLEAGMKNNLKKKAGNKGQSNNKVQLTEEEEKYYKDNQTLMLQVEALQAQLQEQTKLAKEQTEAMFSDRNIKEEEMNSRIQRDGERIAALTEKLHKTQDLLYDSTKDFLQLRYEGREHERKWMAEKDKLLRDLDNCKQQLNVTKDNALNISTATVASRNKSKEEIDLLHYQNDQAQKLATMYREQVIQLEDELARLREEDHVGRQMFKDRSDKMAKRLELMNKRYQDLESRRNLEVEGFKTDIRNLRTRLKDLEKQLYKVTVGLALEDMDELRPDDLDMQILRNVRRTAGHSKEIFDELKTLKSKVYGMESELRHL